MSGWTLFGRPARPAAVVFWLVVALAAISFVFCYGLSRDPLAVLCGAVVGIAFSTVRVRRS